MGFKSSSVGSRALSVFHFLTKAENIAIGRIHIAGFGPNRPIASNSTTSGKRDNRRVEFLMLTAVASLPPKESSILMEQIPESAGQSAMVPAETESTEAEVSEEIEEK